jgi:hypothetical protein
VPTVAPTIADALLFGGQCARALDWIEQQRATKDPDSKYPASHKYETEELFTLTLARLVSNVWCTFPFLPKEDAASELFDWWPVLSSEKYKKWGEEVVKDADFQQKAFDDMYFVPPAPCFIKRPGSESRVEPNWSFPGASESPAGETDVDVLTFPVVSEEEMKELLLRRYRTEEENRPQEESIAIASWVGALGETTRFRWYLSLKGTQSCGSAVQTRQESSTPSADSKSAS